MKNEMYVNEANELAVIEPDKIHEAISFNNCHLVVKYLLWKDPKLMEAIVNEYEAQIRFGDK